MEIYTRISVAAITATFPTVLEKKGLLYTLYTGRHLHTKWNNPLTSPGLFLDKQYHQLSAVYLPDWTRPLEGHNPVRTR